MNNKVFINNAITKAFNDYLDYKYSPSGVKFNSFYVVVVRLLVIIYSEEDLLNPFYVQDEDGFYSVLKTFGYHIDDVLKFEHALEDYYQNETSDGFIFIQKALVDMFIQKRKTVDMDMQEIIDFRNLLYSSNSDNPLRVSYNFLMSNNPNEVVDYFDLQIKKLDIKKVPETKHILNWDAYKLLNYSMEDIENMSAADVNDLNKKVYEYFNINETSVNKNYLLEKALYEKLTSKKKLKHSSGYINIVFILAIVLVLGALIAYITIFVL